MDIWSGLGFQRRRERAKWRRGLVAADIAPAALRSTSWAFVLPYMTILAIAALGQMLVIMQAGIDLSTAGVISLCGNVLVGVSANSDSRLALGILASIGLGALVGLANGFLVAIVRLNPSTDKRICRGLPSISRLSHGGETSK